jgi:hypothetical protein
MKTLPLGNATALLRVVLFAALSSVALAVPAADPASPVTLEGTVVIQVADDFEHGRSRTFHFLRKRGSNDLVQLQLSPEQARHIRPGQELRVRGRQSDKVLAADPDPGSITVLTEATSLAPATTRRVITFIVDITDGSGAQYAVATTCDGTNQILADELFGSQTGGLNVDGCFRDSSYDVLGFGGASYPGTAMDVVRVAINEPSQSLAGICNYDAWAASADAAGVAQGIDPSAYQHRMYVLPAATTGCSWAGLAYVSCGDRCLAWVRTFGNEPCGYPDIIAHELGHNIGLMHARTSNSDDTVSCEYCDTTDIMGYGISRWRGLNAPHRDFMGWLGAGRIVDGAKGGTFTISALGLHDPPFPQVVKVVPPSGSPYWLSFRAPIGYDVQMPSNFNTLFVHRSAFWGDSYLIDQLADGGTHVDETLNLTVTQLSHTADSATLEVKYGAAFSLSTSSLVFGSQFLNTASSAQTITLLSIGGTALPITSIGIGGINPHQFSQTNDCGASLAPGAACTIAVTFKPTSAGSKVATLNVTAGDGAVTRTVSLSGTAVASAFTLSTTSLVFSSQPLNLASSAQTITLRSTGIVALPIASIAIEGLNFSQFAQTNTCGTSVPAGASCAIRVTFKPTNPGSKTAMVNVTAGGAVGTQTVSLSGTAVRSVYTLSTSSLVFASQPLNLASSAKTITLRNTGSTTLPMTSIAIGGINPHQFAQTNNCGTSVPAGASCAIKVTFKPTIVGSKVATLSVIAGGGAGTKNVALAGSGVTSTFSVSPTALAFGNVARNSTSTAKTVRISNTGAVLLPISTIDLAGTNATQFARTHNCPAQLAIGGSCTVSVVFKPTSAGAKSATLRVTPGGGAALKSVALSGTGI